MSDEDDIRLRDQFAMAAMQVFLTNKSRYLSTAELSNNNDGTLDEIAIAAYKMADSMRKARLIVFK